MAAGLQGKRPSHFYVILGCSTEHSEIEEADVAYNCEVMGFLSQMRLWDHHVTDCLFPAVFRYALLSWCIF